MTKRKIEYWVIPPEHDAEFVACMEEVLATYAAAYDPKHPVLCMDEQPVQLLKETRVPIAATTKHGKRVDYEYERHGTASIFLFAEPLSGFRQATARTRRTKADWAIEVAQILDTRYADCTYVTLVCDNLNTHTKGAFYEAFEPGPRAGVLETDQILLHSETRQLAACRGMRAELPDEPMHERTPYRCTDRTAH
jgi:DDE superfamily endonuclease